MKQAGKNNLMYLMAVIIVIIAFIAFLLSYALSHHS